MRDENVKGRVATLQRVLAVAEECRNLHNYNGVMEIMAGLQHSSVWRLQETWSVRPRLFSVIIDSDFCFALSESLLYLSIYLSLSLLPDDRGWIKSPGRSGI